jgi:hypothetical protein
MKKILTLLFGGFIAFIIFGANGHAVKAAELEQANAALNTYFAPMANMNMASDCSCGDTTTILGADRNKIVASLISSKEFQAMKQQMIQSGYTWDGAYAIEVIYNNAFQLNLEVVPFSINGAKVALLFVEGHFVMSYPME